METNVTSPHEDYDLVQQVLHHGRESAYRELYRRYSPEILRRLHRLLGHPEKARDALQQVFLEAYRSLHTYRGESRFGSWLHKIAERVVMGILNKEWRSRSFLERWGLYETYEKVVGSENDSPERDIVREQLRQWVHQCLEKLKPSKRMVLLMCDLEGKTYDEVANVMDLSPGTVASRLHHARKDIKKMLTFRLKQQGLSWEDLLHES